MNRKKWKLLQKPANIKNCDSCDWLKGSLHTNSTDFFSEMFLRQRTITYKIVEQPLDFQFFLYLFCPLAPSQCCSTTKSCRVTRVISISYSPQNNIDRRKGGDETVIFSRWLNNFVSDCRLPWRWLGKLATFVKMPWGAHLRNSRNNCQYRILSLRSKRRNRWTKFEQSGRDNKRSLLLFIFRFWHHMIKTISQGK